MTPHEDRVRSPYTGWTREHWIALADGMLGALEPYRSPGGARVDLPGPVSRSGAASDGLEGFARTFLLAGFRIAGEGGADPGGLLDRYARGLAAGTDPRSPEAWPRPDVVGQAKVEAASVALVLQLTRPWLWDRLDSGVRERAVDWLATVVGQRYPRNNWVWFRIVVESFLREAGGPWSPGDVEEDLAFHASMRRSGGWLSDGEERAYDHYAGWALHFYPLLWAHLFDVGGSLCPPDLRATWAENLGEYLDDAVRLVGADGSPLLQGRSLTYRFAAAAPFWVGAVTGAGRQPPGLVRRVASGMLRHFADRGAPDGAGLLRLGWHGAWPAIRQSYSGFGSPYWASKGMLGLLLPAGHPVWTDPELPLPVEDGDVARVVTAPGWLVSARRRDGFAVVLNHGTDHARPGDTVADSPLYARLGYSTATVPPLTAGSVAGPADNAVVLLDEAGRASHRSGFDPLFAGELPGGVLAAASRGAVRWVDTSADDSPDFGSGRRGPVVPGPAVTVASVLRDGVEIRLARVDAPARKANPPWRGVRLGGWPVAAGVRPGTETGPDGGLEGGPGVPGPFAEARTGTLRSRLRGLRGFHRGGITTERDAGPLGAWTAIPWLVTDGDVPFGEVLAAVVVLDRGGPYGADPSLAVREEAGGGHRAVIVWADGLRTEVGLPAPPPAS